MRDSGGSIRDLRPALFFLGPPVAFVRPGILIRWHLELLSRGLDTGGLGILRGESGRPITENWGADPLVLAVSSPPWDMRISPKCQLSVKWTERERANIT